jgi:DNA adenine methylase
MLDSGQNVSDIFPSLQEGNGMPGLLPYIGGKSKMWGEVYNAIQAAALDGTDEPYWNGQGYEYREPLLGTGSVFLEMVPKKVRAWLNDKDSGMACLWTAVALCPDKLLGLIEDSPPSKPLIENLFDCLMKCKVDPEEADLDRIAMQGWRALAVPYLTFCAVQRGDLRIHVTRRGWSETKWAPAAMRDKVRKAHEKLSKVKLRHGVVTCRDYSDLLNGRQRSLIYCDPPYVKAGWGAYRQGWKKPEKHIDLAAALRACRHKWVLSYDNHPLVKELYGEWCNLKRFTTYYTTNNKTPRNDGQDRNRCAELLITPKDE